METQKTAKKLKCHYCYSCDKNREYVLCSQYSECGQAFCRKCLKNFFKCRKESLPNNWKCFVCEKMCLCESCKESAEEDKEVVIVKDWRYNACLSNEKKYHGPKVYKVSKPKKCEMKLNPIYGKRTKERHAKNSSRDEISNSVDGNKSKPSKKPKLNSNQDDMEGKIFAPMFSYPQGFNQYPLLPNGRTMYSPVIYGQALCVNSAQSGQVLLVTPMTTPLVYNPYPYLFLSRTGEELPLTPERTGEQAARVQERFEQWNAKGKRNSRNIEEVIKQEDMKT